jgi:hypothetical protein
MTLAVILGFAVGCLCGAAAAAAVLARVRAEEVRRRRLSRLIGMRVWEG